MLLGGRLLHLCYTYNTSEQCMEVKKPQVSAQKGEFSNNWNCAKMEEFSCDLVSCYHRVFKKGGEDAVEEFHA